MAGAVLHCSSIGAQPVPSSASVGWGRAMSGMMLPPQGVFLMVDTAPHPVAYLESGGANRGHVQ